MTRTIKDYSNKTTQKTTQVEVENQKRVKRSLRQKNLQLESTEYC